MTKFNAMLCESLVKEHNEFLSQMQQGDRKMVLTVELRDVSSVMKREEWYVTIGIKGTHDYRHILGYDDVRMYLTGINTAMRFATGGGK